MKMNEIKPLITAVQAANDALLMVGIHGIGKTDIVKEWAETNNVHLEVLYLSNQEIGDLIGIPYNVEVNGKMIEKWSTPSWLQRMYEANEKGQPTALFLDEISRAALDVKQSALQLVLDKKIHEHKLPVLNGLETVIVAADNPDNGNYNVEPLDPALLDRFLSVSVEIDPESWLEYARQKNVNKIIRAFIADNPTKLHYESGLGVETDGDIGGGATPRSWVKLSKYMENFENIAPELHYSIISGKIGKGLTPQFISFINNFQSMLSVEDIETLVNDLNNKGAKIEDIGKAVAELTNDTDVLQITELTTALMNKYINSSAKEAIPFMGMMYSLNTEVLVAMFKKIPKDSPENYKKLVQFDIELNNKKLFIEAAKAIIT